MELRMRILDDHSMIRAKADVLEGLALRILRGDEDLGSALRLKGEEIQERLVRHIDWEERELLPALRELGNPEVAERILAEHKAQRQRITETLATLQDSERRPVALARHMVEFVRLLEREMHDEEELVLIRGLGPADAEGNARRPGDSNGDDAPI